MLKSNFSDKNRQFEGHTIHCSLIIFQAKQSLLIEHILTFEFIANRLKIFDYSCEAQKENIIKLTEIKQQNGIKTESSTNFLLFTVLLFWAILSPAGIGTLCKTAMKSIRT